MTHHQQRLSELMMEWRILRDHGKKLSPHKQRELEVLVEAELRTSAVCMSAAFNIHASSN